MKLFHKRTSCNLTTVRFSSARLRTGLTPFSVSGSPVTMSACCVSLFNLSDKPVNGQASEYLSDVLPSTIFIKELYTGADENLVIMSPFFVILFSLFLPLSNLSTFVFVLLTVLIFLHFLQLLLFLLLSPFLLPLSPFLMMNIYC